MQVNVFWGRGLLFVSQPFELITQEDLAESQSQCYHRAAAPSQEVRAWTERKGNHGLELFLKHI